MVVSEPTANPGMSITNAVEELATQVIERYEIDPERPVWMQHYLLGAGGGRSLTG